MAFLDYFNQFSGLIIAIAAFVAAFEKIIKPLWSGYRVTKNGIKKKTHEVIENEVKSTIKEEYEDLLNVDVATFEGKIDAIIKSDQCQLTRLMSIEGELIAIRECNKNILRSELNRIYYTYFPFKKILEYDKECFEKLYADYKQIGGNSYVDDMRTILLTWETVMSFEELKK